LRFARGVGNAWMERLYALITALPHAEQPEEMAHELPDVMTPALRSA
jgi:hypothetical protein